MKANQQQWLADLAQRLAPELGGARQHLLLYLEMAEGWSGGATFIDEGNRIMSISPGREWWATLYHKWEDLAAEDRWSAMRLLLTIDGSFTASFEFPDALDVSDLDHSTRETAAARAAFGDKPIHYPPLSEDAFDISDDRHGFDTPLG